MEFLTNVFSVWMDRNFRHSRCSSLADHEPLPRQRRSTQPPLFSAQEDDSPRLVWRSTQDSPAELCSARSPLAYEVPLFVSPPLYQKWASSLEPQRFPPLFREFTRGYSSWSQKTYVSVSLPWPIPRWVAPACFCGWYVIPRCRGHYGGAILDGVRTWSASLQSK